MILPGKRLFIEALTSSNKHFPSLTILDPRVREGDTILLHKSLSTFLTANQIMQKKAPANLWIFTHRFWTGADLKLYCLTRFVYNSFESVFVVHGKFR